MIISSWQAARPKAKTFFDQGLLLQWKKKQKAFEPRQLCLCEGEKNNNQKPFCSLFGSGRVLVLTRYLTAVQWDDFIIVPGSEPEKST